MVKPALLERLVLALSVIALAVDLKRGVVEGKLAIGPAAVSHVTDDPSPALFVVGGRDVVGVIAAHVEALLLGNVLAWYPKHE